MIFIDTLINFAAVLLAGILGSLLRKGIPERVSQTLLHGMALCVIYIGLADIVDYVTVYSVGEEVGKLHVLIPILSLAVGAAIGELLRLDRGMERLGAWAQKTLRGEGDSRIAEGFVTAATLFCVGAMAIIGSVRSGLLLDHGTLITKALIDGISTLVLASTLGIGTALSAFAVLVYQGTVTLAAYLVGRLAVGGDAAAMPEILSAMPAINEMSCVGALIIIAIGLNMLGASKIRVVNLVPALFFPFLLCLFL